MPAFAGWQYDGYYTSDGYSYSDDGSRFVVGFRGGLAFSSASLKNDIGSLYTDYYVNDSTGAIVSQLAWENAGAPEGYSDVGYGDLATLPVKDDFKKTTFTAGASLGFTLANNSQWRLEIGYDYIAETDYNKTPLLEGNMTVIGDEGDSVVHVVSTGAKSTISTDIVSAMAYYDFFDGKAKKLNTFIPYVGFGLGYAISKTTLHLTDIYGDLSLEEDLKNYGTQDPTTGIITFDNPTDRNSFPSSTNLAAIGALGFSYGIAESTFIDASLRLMYVPKVTWNIANTAGTQHREWFSAENMIYTNLVVGIRFEF